MPKSSVLGCVSLQINHVWSRLLYLFQAFYVDFKKVQTTGYSILVRSNRGTALVADTNGVIVSCTQAHKPGCALMPFNSFFEHLAAKRRQGTPNCPLRFLTGEISFGYNPAVGRFIHREKVWRPTLSPQEINNCEKAESLATRWKDLHGGLQIIALPWHKIARKHLWPSGLQLLFKVCDRFDICQFCRELILVLNHPESKEFIQEVLFWSTVWLVSTCGLGERIPPLQIKDGLFVVDGPSISFVVSLRFLVHLRLKMISHRADNLSWKSRPLRPLSNHSDYSFVSPAKFLYPRLIVQFRHGLIMNLCWLCTERAVHWGDFKSLSF